MPVIALSDLVGPIRRLAAFGLVLALVACGSDSGPGTGPDPDPDPDPDPIDTEPDLECGLPDHPCAWGAVPAAVVDRTLALADEGVARLRGGDSAADVSAWLDGQADVAEVQADDLAIRFRVEGGRGLWIYRPGATLTGPAPGAIRPDADRPRAADRPARHVVGDSPTKRAVVLSPSLWDFTPQWDDGEEIAAILASTRGYSGETVVYRSNPDQVSVVGPEAFTDWDTFDVVHYTGHGKRVCYPSGCRAALDIGLLDIVIPGDASTTAKILQIDELGLELRIGEETGNMYVLAAADFFRDHYPGGLEDTVVFLNACQAVGPQAVDLAEALRGSSSVVLGWSESVYASDAGAAAIAFYEDLSERGYPTEVAFQRLGELRTGTAEEGEPAPQLTRIPRQDGDDLHIRELVTLLNPGSGAELADAPSVSIVGDAGDGEPDQAPFRVRVEGILEDFAGDVTVFVTVDGVSADPVALSEGTKNDDDAWEVEGMVQLPYDLTDDRSVTVEARVTLHTGGESRHEATALLTGAEPLMGYEWEVVAEHTTYWTGISPDSPHNASAVLRLEWAPGQDPADPNPEYILTGGTVTWDWSHVHGSCSYSGPTVVFDVNQTIAVGSKIVFDTSSQPATYTGRLRTFGDLYTIASQCEETSGTLEIRAQNIWVDVPSGAPEAVSADGRSITGTYRFVNQFSTSAHIMESQYTMTRIR